MKTVLITGYRGLIGQSLFNLLVANEEFEVIVVGSPSDEFGDLPKNVLGFNMAQILEGNLQGYQFDVVVNCAISYENVVVGENSPLVVNLQLPLFILESVAGKGTHFINLDSSLIKGHLPYLARPIYSLSKMHLKDYLKMKARGGQIRVSNLILEHVYGLSTLKRNTLLSELIASGVSGEVEDLKLSPGDQVRDFVYVEDVAAAIYDVIQNRFSKFQQDYLDIPVGSGQGVKLREVIMMIEEKLQLSSTYSIGSAPYRDNEIMYSVANIDIMTELGWSPKVSLDEGLNILLKFAGQRSLN